MTEDSRDKKWEERGQRAYSDFTDRPARTGFKWFLMICAAAIVIAIVVGVIGFIGGWFSKAGEVVGPENTEQQFTTIIGAWKGMEQAAINACEVEGGEQTDSDTVFPEDPAFAYRAQYRNIATDYNRQQNNLFEGGIVGPPGYPDEAPAIDAMIARLTQEGSIAPGTCAAAR